MTELTSILNSYGDIYRERSTNETNLQGNSIGDLFINIITADLSQEEEEQLLKEAFSQLEESVKLESMNGTKSLNSSKQKNSSIVSSTKNKIPSKSPNKDSKENPVSPQSKLKPVLSMQSLVEKIEQLLREANNEVELTKMTQDIENFFEAKLSVDQTFLVNKAVQIWRLGKQGSANDKAKVQRLTMFSWYLQSFTAISKG